MRAGILSLLLGLGAFACVSPRQAPAFGPDAGEDPPDGEVTALPDADLADATVAVRAEAGLPPTSITADAGLPDTGTTADAGLPPGSDASCAAGARTCQGGSLVVCRADGSGTDTSPCAWGCNAARGACNSCSPGAKTCKGTALETCNAEGSAPIATECASGCNAVRLECNRCTPNKRTCNGRNLEACRSDGSGVDVTTCASGCNGAAGECNGCEPSAVWCNGNVLRECTSAGQPMDRATCPSGCNTALKQCNACAPGAVQCSGSGLQTCKSDGSDWMTQDCGAAGCNGARLACNACTPGAAQCSGSGLQTCKSDGSGWTSQSCPHGCSGGACNACSAGAKQCSGSSLQTCKSDGSGWTSQSCGAGCNGTRLECNACSPNSKQCSGSIAQACKADGTGWNQQDCTGAASCTEGADGVGAVTAGATCSLGDCVPGPSSSCAPFGCANASLCAADCDYGFFCEDGACSRGPYEFNGGGAGAVSASAGTLSVGSGPSGTNGSALVWQILASVPDAEVKLRIPLCVGSEVYLNRRAAYADVQFSFYVQSSGGALGLQIGLGNASGASELLVPDASDADGWDSLSTNGWTGIFPSTDGKGSAADHIFITLKRPQGWAGTIYLDYVRMTRVPRP